MALEDDELPGGGWTKLGELCFRTGGFRIDTSVARTEEARRAYRAKTFTTRRSFRRSGASQSLDTQVIPYASANDAESSVHNLRTTWQIDPRRNIAVISERQLDPNEIPDVAGYPFLYEQSILGKQGQITNKSIGGTVGNVVLLIAASGPDGGWSWRDVASVTAAQVLKIQVALIS